MCMAMERLRPYEVHMWLVLCFGLSFLGCVVEIVMTVEQVQILQENAVKLRRRQDAFSPVECE
jgi:heme exporter protein D